MNWIQVDSARASHRYPDATHAGFEWVHRWSHIPNLTHTRLPHSVDVKQKFTVWLDCEAQTLLCINHSYAHAIQYSPQMKLRKVSKYSILLLIPLSTTTTINIQIYTLLLWKCYVFLKFDVKQKVTVICFCDAQIVLCQSLICITSVIFKPDLCCCHF